MKALWMTALIFFSSGALAEMEADIERENYVSFKAGFYFNPFQEWKSVGSGAGLAFGKYFGQTSLDIGLYSYPKQSAIQLTAARSVFKHSAFISTGWELFLGLGAQAVETTQKAASKPVAGGTTDDLKNPPAKKEKNGEWWYGGYYMATGAGLGVYHDIIDLNRKWIVSLRTGAYYSSAFKGGYFENWKEKLLHYVGLDIKYRF